MTIDLKISMAFLMLLWSVASVIGWLVMFGMNSEMREYSGNGATLERYFFYWLEIWFKVLIGIAAVGFVARFCKPNSE
jgi:hypothetical protein